MKVKTAGDLGECLAEEILMAGSSPVLDGTRVSGERRERAKAVSLMGERNITLDREQLGELIARALLVMYPEPPGPNDIHGEKEFTCPAEKA